MLLFLRLRNVILQMQHSSTSKSKLNRTCRIIKKYLVVVENNDNSILKIKGLKIF